MTVLPVYKLRFFRFKRNNKEYSLILTIFNRNVNFVLDHGHYNMGSCYLFAFKKMDVSFIIWKI